MGTTLHSHPYTSITPTMSDAPSWDKLFNVRGKVVLVTGGSRGIGKMIATGFVAAGCKVYITSRDSKACDETAGELNKMGPGNCVAIPADLAKLSEVDRLVAEIQKKEKKLHVLVNNAGATWGESIAEFPDQAFAKVMLLNVHRVFTLTQKLMPLLEGPSSGSRVVRPPLRIPPVSSTSEASTASRCQHKRLTRTQRVRLVFTT